MDLVTLVGILLLLVVIGAIFLIARRILRIAVKLAFTIAIIFVVIVGAGVGWWRGWFETGKQNRVPAATTDKRAAPANRSPR